MGEKNKKKPDEDLIEPLSDTHSGEWSFWDATAPISVTLLKKKLAASNAPSDPSEKKALQEVTEPINMEALQKKIEQCRHGTQSSDPECPYEAIEFPDVARAAKEFELVPTQPMDPQLMQQKISECRSSAPDPVLEDDVPITVAEPVNESRPSVTPPPPPPPPSPRPTATKQVQRLTPSSSSPVYVAMDFGTTRCRVAALVNDQVYLLPMPDGHPDMPSVVGFDERGNARVGEEARAMLTSDPTNVVVAPRRLLGRRFMDPGIGGLLLELPMPSSEGPNGEIVLHLQSHAYSVTQICAALLCRLRAVAQYHLEREVIEVVLTTPISFDTRQRMALSRAAQIAGFQVIQFVDEPVAAAVANRHDPGFRDLVGVYDFGGATFDFSVVDIRHQIRVVAAASDPWLGGSDFEEVLANAAADDFWGKHRIELRNNVVQWQRLLMRAELAKQELSQQPQTVLCLPDAAFTHQGGLSVNFPITRPDFARLSGDLIGRSLATCQEALHKRGLRSSDLHCVFLSSGTTYIPAVQDAVARYFGQQPRLGVPPERAILLGAAIYTAYLRRMRQAAQSTS